MEIESSLHLYQPPLYRSNRGKWHNQFIEAASDSSNKLSWDVSAIMGILGFGYTTGDRTLVNEIKRLPWLSRIGTDNEPVLEKVPEHRFLWEPVDKIAATFSQLLADEAEEVCRGKQHIYILLSGGLDSRIAAAVVAKLLNEGRLNVKPVAVTWGLPQCRDVFYGCRTAKILGFDWQHIDFTAEHLLENVENVSLRMGCLISPVHLHRLNWFQSVPRDSLVLIGSFGDMIGRAEASGRHLLELDFLRPVNMLGLMNGDAAAEAYSGIKQDIELLHSRTSEHNKIELCELETVCFYLRGMLGHMMTVINASCTAYQMFTAPQVYRYIWSIHPALRTDNIYAAMLEQLSEPLARLPWARTNRALSGRTEGSKSGLIKNFHEYEKWTAGPLFEKISRYVEPEWFEQTGIFNAERIQYLANQVREGGNGKGPYGFIPYEKWLWLASFRRMAEFLRDMGKSVEFNKDPVYRLQNNTFAAGNAQRSLLRRIIGRSPLLYGILKDFKAAFGKVTKNTKRAFLRYEAKRKYPPQKADR